MATQGTQPSTSRNRRPRLGFELAGLAIPYAIVRDTLPLTFFLGLGGSIYALLTRVAPSFAVPTLLLCLLGPAVEPLLVWAGWRENPWMKDVDQGRRIGKLREEGKEYAVMLIGAR